MIQIRKYTDKDRTDVLECVKQIRDELGWSPIGEKYASDLLDISGTYFSGRGEFWLLTDGDKIVGTCGLKDMGEKRGLLKRLYLDKNYRGQKLGKKLFQNAIKYAKDNNIETLYLGTGYKAAVAIKMYDGMGLTRIDSFPDDFGDYGDEIFYKLETK